MQRPTWSIVGPIILLQRPCASPQMVPAGISSIPSSRLKHNPVRYEVKSTRVATVLWIHPLPTIHLVSMSVPTAIVIRHTYPPQFFPAHQWARLFQNWTNAFVVQFEGYFHETESPDAFARSATRRTRSRSHLDIGRSLIYSIYCLGRQYSSLESIGEAIRRRHAVHFAASSGCLVAGGIYPQPLTLIQRRLCVDLPGEGRRAPLQFMQE